MQLTGEQIVSRGIITNYVPEAVQQQGVDVRIKNLRKVFGCGCVPAEGKTRLPNYIDVAQNDDSTWIIQPGYYEVELMESCSIPNNAVLNYKTRSSLVRCGSQVLSGQFDAGFRTDTMGCFLRVDVPIIIEPGARIAQAIVTESYSVEEKNLYNGQWQEDCQRKTK